MSLTLELPPETEAALRQEAEHAGVQPEELAVTFVQQRLKHKEWLERLRAWSESHDPNIPTLSDYAVSRESFYEDRL